jgi:hypothetical protein
MAGSDAADDFEIRYRLPDPHKPVPYIEFEVRLPAGTRLPDDVHVLHTAQRRDDIDDDRGYFLHDNWKRFDGDRPVLMGSTAIRKPTKHPKLTLKLLEGSLLVFDFFISIPSKRADRGFKTATEGQNRPKPITLYGGTAISPRSYDSRMRAQLMQDAILLLLKSAE